MKLLILSVTLALSLNASAGCLEVRRDAHATMDARQRGVDVNVVLNIARGKSETDDIFGAYFRMILSAYNEPQFRTKRYQAKASNKFADKYFMACKQVSA